MNPLIAKLANQIRDSFNKIQPPIGWHRPTSKAIFEALKTVSPLIEDNFGGPIFCRYAGCQKKAAASENNKRRFKAIEYLWDFSLSRFQIPDAIEQKGAEAIQNGKFELLFVAESEIGQKDEVCRD